MPRPCRSRTVETSPATVEALSTKPTALPNSDRMTGCRKVKMGRGKDELIGAGKGKWFKNFAQDGSQLRCVGLSAFDHGDQIVVPGFEDAHVRGDREAGDKVVEKLPLGRGTRGQ